jgi:hypothetical protein
MPRFRVTLWGRPQPANSAGSPFPARSSGANRRRRECYPGSNQAEFPGTFPGRPTPRGGRPDGWEKRLDGSLAKWQRRGKRLTRYFSRTYPVTLPPCQRGTPAAGQLVNRPPLPPHLQKLPSFPHTPGPIPTPTGKRRATSAGSLSGRGHCGRLEQSTRCALGVEGLPGRAHTTTIPRHIPRSSSTPPPRGESANGPTGQGANGPERFLASPGILSHPRALSTYRYQPTCHAAAPPAKSARRARPATPPASCRLPPAGI